MKFVKISRQLNKRRATFYEMLCNSTRISSLNQVKFSIESLVRVLQLFV